jgi:hypothetical protein
MKQKLKAITVIDPHTFTPTAHVVDEDTNEQILKANLEFFDDLKYGHSPESMANEEVYDKFRELSKHSSGKSPELIDEACNVLFAYFDDNRAKNKTEVITQ